MNYTEIFVPVPWSIPWYGLQFKQISIEWNEKVQFFSKSPGFLFELAIYFSLKRVWYKIIYGIRKCCIGCITAYTYVNYVYFKDSIDAPKEHHNQLILNQESYSYITSLSKFIDETLTLLHRLLVDKLKKMNEQTYQSCGSVIKIRKTEQRKSKNGTNVCGKINREKYFELSWFFKYMWCN